MFEAKDSAAFAGLVLGAVGTILGCRAEWRNSRNERVRLQVRPLLGWITKGGLLPVTEPRDVYRQFASTSQIPLVGLEVINLSAFAITIAEVGTKQSDEDERTPIFRPMTIRGHPELPTRLEPRTNATFLSPATEFPISKRTQVYARTQCGKTVFAHNGLFAELEEIIAGLNAVMNEPAA